MPTKFIDKLNAIIERYPKALSIFSFITFVLIVSFSLLGTTIPRDMDKYQKLGYFSVQPFRLGIFITQQGTGLFYNVSPYNDYYIKNSSRVALISNSEKILSNESQIDEKWSKIPVLKTIDAIRSYLDKYTNKVTFDTPIGIYTYRTIKSGNKLVIHVSSTQIPPEFLTLSFNESDIVVDDFGRVYTLTTLSQVEEINHIYNLNLSTEKASSTERVQNIYIINSRNNGVLKINLLDSNSELEKVDPVNFLVEMKLKNPNDAKIQITSVDSIKDLYVK